MPKAASIDQRKLLLCHTPSKLLMAANEQRACQPGKAIKIAQRASQRGRS
jgi:hypothetical protein